MKTQNVIIAVTALTLGFAIFKYVSKKAEKRKKEEEQKKTTSEVEPTNVSVDVKKDVKINPELGPESIKKQISSLHKMLIGGRLTPEQKNSIQQKKSFAIDKLKSLGWESIYIAPSNSYTFKQI